MRKYNHPNVLPIFTSFVHDQVHKSGRDALLCVFLSNTQLTDSMLSSDGFPLIAGAMDCDALLPRRISAAYYEVWSSGGGPWQALLCSIMLCNTRNGATLLAPSLQGRLPLHL